MSAEKVKGWGCGFVDFFIDFQIRLLFSVQLWSDNM